jgi:hypothetical protein
MNHATTFLFGTLFFWLFIRTMRYGHHIDAIGAGAALGMVMITRPLTALGLCLPYAGWALWKLLRQPRHHFARFVWMAAALMLFAAFQLYFNAMTTGNPFLYGYEKLHGSAHHPGFGTKLWLEHTPWRGIHNAMLDAWRMNVMQFEWVVPGLFLSLLAFLSLTRNRCDYLYAATFFSLAGAYVFSQFNEGIFGPRLIYESSGLLLILAAHGICRLPMLLRLLCGRRVNIPLVRGGMGIFMALCFATGWPLQLPTRLEDYKSPWCNGDVHFYRTMMTYPYGPALIIVQEHNYSKVAFTNPPLPDAPVIFIHTGPGVSNIIRAYPERYLYYESEGVLRLARSPIRKITPPVSE